MVGVALLLSVLAADVPAEVVDASPRPTVDLDLQAGRVYRPADSANASQVEIEGGYEPLECVVVGVRVSGERWNQPNWTGDVALMPGAALVSKEGVVRPWLSFHTGPRLLSIDGTAAFGLGVAAASGIDVQLTQAFGVRLQVGLDVLMPGPFPEVVAWINGSGGLTWSF